MSTSTTMTGTAPTSTQSATLDATAFLSLLSEQLRVGTRTGESEYNRLQGKVEQLHHSGVHLVCFFDDFHFITRNTNFPLEFFSFLRIFPGMDA